VWTGQQHKLPAERGNVMNQLWVTEGSTVGDGRYQSRDL